MKIELNVKPPENKGHKPGRKPKYTEMYTQIDNLAIGSSISIRVSIADLNNVRTSAYRHAYDKGYKISTSSGKNILYITRKGLS